MIRKERLEELIEQGADVWVLYENKIYPHKAKDVAINGFNCVSIGFDFNHLFETKEDAEEYAEFGNITRTERLPYFPKYENIEYERGHFIRKFHIKDNYDGFGKLMVIKDSVILVQCSSLGVLHEEYFNKPATRENYNEARRLCVKLFKGETDVI